MMMIRLASIWGLIGMFCAPFAAAQTPAGSTNTKPSITSRTPDYSIEREYLGKASIRRFTPGVNSTDGWDVRSRMVPIDNPRPHEVYQKRDNERWNAKLQHRESLTKSNSGTNPANLSKNIDQAGAELPSNSTNLPVIQPQVVSSFQTVFDANAIPADGACAVSPEGFVVTSNNTHIAYYDEDGNVIASMTHETFFSSFSPSANLYDPRLIFDQVHDRFIFVLLHGNTSALNEVWTAISDSSDPTQGWTLVAFSGALLDMGITGLDPESTWLDYPSIGISEGCLAITGNQYTDEGSYHSSRICVMNLDQAMNGEAPDLWIFEDVEAPDEFVGIIDYSAGSIIPCSNPFGLYGPDMFFIARRNNEDVVWFRITTPTASSSSLDAYVVDIGEYNSPLPAPQSGADPLIVQNRMQSAYLNSVSGEYKIYFSMVVADANGDNDLLLGRLNLGTEGVVSSTFGASGWDYAYPWIIPWAKNAASWDGGSLVAFLRVSSSTFPEFRVVHAYPYTTSGQNWGSSVGIKAGESPIINSSNRWGDYLGGGWRDGQNDPEVWVYGQYGLSDAVGTWTAQVKENLEGCMDPLACNYDPNATLFEGTCQYENCSGCMDPEACNYDPLAVNDFWGECTYPGCNNLVACNYNANAGCDDGSCCFNHCINLEMAVGFNSPGFNSMLYFSVTDNATGLEVMSGNNSSGTANLCLETGCYTVDITGSNSNWSLVEEPTFFIFGENYTLNSGTGPSTFEVIIGNEEENTGCTDASACNYDSGAICDDGTCCYSSCVEVNMTDEYGDGWNGNVWVIERLGEVVSTGTLSDGVAGTVKACLDPGCYHFFIDPSQGQYQFELGWSLGNVEPSGLLGGWDDEASFTLAGGGEDLGCTVLFACNFDPNATCDDGSCCYDHCVDLIVSDTYGDGWNYATMTLTNMETGASQELTMTSGSLDTLGLCLDPGCYDVVLNSGIYPEEVGWQLDYQGAGVFGGAPHEGQFHLEVTYGCTDIQACNYSAQASCNDNSCIYPNCMDPMACNYNGTATCMDNALCDYGCAGCTYDNAMNYNATATTDNGTCEFSITPVTCGADLDGDGSVGTSDLLELLTNFGADC